jgi:hypothetical protein
LAANWAWDAKSSRIREGWNKSPAIARGSSDVRAGRLLTFFLERRGTEFLIRSLSKK